MAVTEEQIQQWLLLSETLKEFRKREMELRKIIAANYVNLKGPAIKVDEILHTEKNSYRIKVDHKETNTVDVEIYTGYLKDKAFSAAEKECFKISVGLLKSKLKDIDDNSIVYNCFSTKPAAPSLTITENN